MIDCFFFDSYAIIEIFKGSPKYKVFLDSMIIITKLNLFEVYYKILRDFGQDMAKSILEKYQKFVIDYDSEIIASAAKFKLENKSKNLSMADCIGYKLAEYLNIKFLTGDCQFEKLPNVEYVK